ncbi:MAG: hypothetical protein QXU11_12465 [Thermoproteota archaeon]
MSKNQIELGRYLNYIKNQIKQSEWNRPEKGFWIGVQTVEVEIEAITEIDSSGGLKVYVLRGGISKKEQHIQRIKIGLVTQYYSPGIVVPG